ncbi:MAG: hypothetical protein WBP64_01750 [Nitrososphaeraceae archaeon]|jgi:transposase-like protein
MAAAEHVKSAAREQRFECNICKKAFENWYILNYHKLLEHSESKRPPTGVG